MKKNNAIVIINEQHNLMEDQKRVLNEMFNSFEIWAVPAEGWNLKQQEHTCKDLFGSLHENDSVVFASPIPFMVKEMAKLDCETLVFHNDVREKKELPNGKVISVVAQTGWQIV